MAQLLPLDIIAFEIAPFLNVIRPGRVINRMIHRGIIGLRGVNRKTVYAIDRCGPELCAKMMGKNHDKYIVCASINRFYNNNDRFYDVTERNIFLKLFLCCRKKSEREFLLNEVMMEMICWIVNKNRGKPIHINLCDIAEIFSEEMQPLSLFLRDFAVLLCCKDKERWINFFEGENVVIDCSRNRIDIPIDLTHILSNPSMLDGTMNNGNLQLIFDGGRHTFTTSLLSNCRYLYDYVMTIAKVRGMTSLQQIGCDGETFFNVLITPTKVKELRLSSDHDFAIHDTINNRYTHSVSYQDQKKLFDAFVDRTRSTCEVTTLPPCTIFDILPHFFPSIEKLDFIHLNDKIDEIKLKILSLLKNLTSLSIMNCKIENGWNLFPLFATVKSLTLFSNVEDENLEYISMIPNLTKLNIESYYDDEPVKNMSEKGISYILKMKSMKHFYIGVEVGFLYDHMRKLGMYLFCRDQCVVEKFDIGVITHCTKSYALGQINDVLPKLQKIMPATEINMKCLYYGL